MLYYLKQNLFHHHFINLAFLKAVQKYSKLDNSVIPYLISEKENVIKKDGLLEYYHPEDGLNGIGGLNNLKEWLKVRGNAFSQKAIEYGIDTPKGVMLLGLPGCGKSLTAKCIARAWNYPLLRFDLGKVFGGVVGQSEANMRKALDVATTIAPCVLWIDEIEKGLSGLGSSDRTDGGTASRVFGSLLTWMQEKKEPVFVVATANRLELPPELFRRGRFDEVFYVDFPTKTEAEQILRLHLRKRCRQEERGSIDKLNLSSSLAKMFAGGSDLVYSGADVMSVASIALEKRFLSIDDAESQNPRPKLSIEDAVKAIIDGETVKPIGKTMKDEIKGIREKFRKMGLQSASKK
mgnify:CR=1 FL=1